jgi:hypothetical protein
MFTVATSLNSHVYVGVALFSLVAIVNLLRMLMLSEVTFHGSAPIATVYLHASTRSLLFCCNVVSHVAVAHRQVTIFVIWLSFNRWHFFPLPSSASTPLVSMSSAKRVVPGPASPLDNAGILLHVLDILGPGHHLFVSAVSKAWQDCYKRVASIQLAELTWNYYEEAVVYTITHQTTLCSAVFASASQVCLARECGLTFNGGQLQRIASRVANVSTLRVAHESGLQLEYEVTVGAAEAQLHRYLSCSGCTQRKAVSCTQA